MKSLIGLLLMLSLAVITLGQGVTSSMLLKPPADSWPTYHGDYSGRHHSALTQITPANVGSLSQTWSFQISEPVKSTPILVNKMLYISAQENV